LAKLATDVYLKQRKLYMRIFAYRREMASKGMA